jgi:hypothetical protein
MRWGTPARGPRDGGEDNEPDDRARKRKAPAKLPAAFRHLLLSPLRDNWLSLDGAFKATSSRLARDPGQARGRLRIGDDWNAITIIARSQSNPLKAIAELRREQHRRQARAVTITRGRHGIEQYLSIRDDGRGVPRAR